MNRMYTLSQQPPDRAGCPAFYSMEMNEMKTMKKLTALLLALTMALALTACSSAGGDPTQPPETKPAETQPAETQPAADPTDTPTEEPGSKPAAFTTVEEGKLHMSTNAAFPPYIMLNDDNSFTGIDAEIAQAIAQKLGLELVVDDMGFQAALTAAQNGESDFAMGGVSITEERKANMDFSDSYATGVQVIIVKEDSPIQTKDDLVNAQMIGCQADTTGYIYCSDTPENGGYGEDHVTAYDTGALAVMDLVAGTIDAVVIDNEPAKEYVAQNPGLKILETEWLTEDYAVAFQKGNDALKDAVNAALAEMVADGSLQAILDQYIKAD